MQLSSIAENAQPRGVASGATELAAHIVRTFNTWAYKREQPSNMPLLLNVVGDAAGQRRPISFVLYWGKGPRSRIAQADLQCLAYLQGFVQRIKAVHRPGATITLLLTDTHAMLNNHAQDSIDSYFADVRDAAQSFGFATRRLSDVVRRSGMAADKSRIAEIPETVLELLTTCAAKWYGGPNDAKTGARHYLEMNLCEKRAVEIEYPGSIFITFNGSDYRSIFPEKMPIFYMYSIKKGVAVKPWFMADEAPCPAPKVDAVQAVVI